MKPSRRLMIGGAAAIAGAALLARPRERSGPRDAYFVSLQRALKEAGIAAPTLVIDRNRLDANIRQLKSDLPPEMNYRIVVKSLPSLALVDHVRKRAVTDRLMTFNLPMLQSFGEAMPEARQFLGKPLPVDAARAFFGKAGVSNTEAADRIVWLIDSPDRLRQYSELARGIGRPLNIAIELDVGLHRGGQVPGEELAAMFAMIKSGDGLRFAGMMGYEPHIPSIPSALGIRKRSLEYAWSTYQAAKDQARAQLGADALDGKILNAAGSPTYRLYRDTGIANEVSVGSALVKPLHFDTELLAPFEPAAFIAAPVIKRQKTELPQGLRAVTSWQGVCDVNTRETIFIYGGNWLAEPVDPPGLQFNKLFGRSSNQEMLNGGPGLNLAPDDFVFFRPTQSEAVLLQFGDIAVYDGEKIVDFWAPLPASA